jgi:putative ABC transport system permease protein
MRWVNRISHRIRSLFRRGAVEQELERELQFHLERQTAENIAAGMTAEEARRAARREFGGLEQVKEECRDERRVNRLENLGADLRYGLRTLRKSPGFAVLSVLTLALGIGANTAVFSMVNALLLHPYKFHDLDRLVRVWEYRAVDEGFDSRYVAAADAEDLRANGQVFEAVTTYGWRNFSLNKEGEAQAILGARVSANFFDLLGAVPATGRLFTPPEEQPGLDSVAIVGHGLWQRQFGGDPQLIGKTVVLNGSSYTVIGIMPKDFSFPVPVEIWVPLALTPEEKADRGQLSFQMLARLKPEVSAGQARAAIASISRRLAEDFPKTNSGRVATLLELRKELYTFTLPMFSLLQAAAGFVLLLACANLANLVFARMIGRQREIAVRTALGAGRGQLGQLFVSEALELSLIAGGVAIAASFWSVRALRTGIPVGWTKWVPGWEGIQVNANVLTFGILLALGVGLFFGLATVLHTGKVELSETLKDASRGTMSRAKGRLRSGLVVAQVMFAMVLLVCAGLMIQGFVNLAKIYQGFEPANVLRIEITLPEKKYSDKAKVKNFYQQLVQQTAALPGVQNAAMITNPPASNVDSETTVFTIEGRSELKASDQPSADLQIASADYFRALKIPLVAGRLLSDTDSVESSNVAMINNGMARQFWPRGDAVGHRFKLGAPDSAEPWITVVGVVGDVRQNWWNAVTRAVIYRPFTQAPVRSLTMVVRTETNPTSYVASVREVVKKLDSGIALRGVNTLENEVADSIAIVRIMGILMGVFGIVALALSSVGVYGVLSESVAQRTREIGIRLALGANPGDLMGLVLGQALKLTGIGLAIAVPISFAVSRAMASLVFGIVQTDIAVLLGFAVLLIFVAVLAGYVPARRAMRMDPMTSLRYE